MCTGATRDSAQHVIEICNVFTLPHGNGHFFSHKVCFLCLRDIYR